VGEGAYRQIRLGCQALHRRADVFRRCAVHEHGLHAEGLHGTGALREVIPAEHIALRADHEAGPYRKSGAESGLGRRSCLADGVHGFQENEVHAALLEPGSDLPVLGARGSRIGGQVRPERVLERCHHTGYGHVPAGRVARLASEVNRLQRELMGARLQPRSPDVPHVVRAAEDVQVEAVVQLGGVGADDVGPGFDVLDVERRDFLRIGTEAVPAPAHTAAHELAAQRPIEQRGAIRIK
jgi:hypothetical protein